MPPLVLLQIYNVDVVVTLSELDFLAKYLASSRPSVSPSLCLQTVFHTRTYIYLTITAKLHKTAIVQL